MSLTSDDLLRDRLRHLADVRPGPLEDVERGLRRRLTARRRRRHAAMAGAVVLIGGAVTGTALVATDPPAETVVAGDPGTDTATVTPVAIERIQVHEDADRTRIVIDLAGPLPTDGATSTPAYVADTAAASSAKVEYTTQPPEEVHVCGDTHFFPRESRGSVDVLLPSAWVEAPPGGPPVEHVGPAPHPQRKVVWCGPYEGVVQLSLWGLGPDRPEDVTVEVTPDRTQIVLEAPPTI